MWRNGFLWISLSVILVNCQPPRNNPTAQKPALSGNLVIFHAGSLSVPFQTISQAFEAEHPGVKVLLEAAGSVACARKITDLKKPCDIMASSDYKVIEDLLIPEYAGWHIPFASNEMVIAFNEKSTGHLEINPQNWPSLLLKDDVFFGRADPNSDPCGYRTVMTFQLASKYYGIPDLEDRLSAKDQKYIRPKEVDLLALLEISEIDYIFIYKSVAVQHQLKYLELPVEINLLDPALDEQYRQAVVRMNTTEPGQSMEMRGEAMIYSFTMLDNAPNRVAAEAFMAFLLETDKGMKIMEEEGQKSVVPASNKYYDKIPIALRKYARSLTNVVSD
jgi:molybdate/tungstate transport system substrate-binding protein